MADLTTETVTSTGVDATANAADAEGDTVEYGTLLRVVNGGENPVTVTLVTPGTEDGDLEIADREITVPAGEARYVKAAGRVYRNPDTGRVALEYSAVTDVTVEVVK